MGKANNTLEKIELKSSLWAIWIILILISLFWLIGLKYSIYKNFVSSIIASLVGVLIAVIFINVISIHNKQNFKRVYFLGFSPILKRLFRYIYIDLKSMINFENKGIRMLDYKSVLDDFNKLILNKEFLKSSKQTINVFNIHKQNLINQISLNSTYLSPDLVLQVSKIIERLGSLVLQTELNDKELILKNIKGIFRHLKIIDDKVIRLDLDNNHLILSLN